MLDGDFFDDVGEFHSNNSMQQADINAITLKLKTEGFRLGRAKKEEFYVQQNFDEGFKLGMEIGSVCGDLFCCIKNGINKYKVSFDIPYSTILKELSIVLFEWIPSGIESVVEISLKINNILASLNHIPFQTELELWNKVMKKHYKQYQIIKKRYEY